jgi:hypothetical protein
MPLAELRSLSIGELVDFAAVLFASKTVGDVKLKRLLLTEFARIAAPGVYADWSQVEEMISDLGIGLSDQEINSILRATMLWERRGTSLRLRESVELDEGIDGLGELRTTRLNVLQFLEALSETADIDAITPTDVAATIRDARNSLWVVAERSARLSSGLPTTFWSLTNDDNQLVPMGDKPSAITLLDILNATFETAEDITDSEAGSFISSRLDAISDSIDRCLRYVRSDHRFKDLIYVEGDDDFVEENLLPNLPTVALFVRAISSEQEWRTRLGLAPRPETISQIRAAMNFLFRMQRPDGAWGVYHYDPPVGFEAPSHPYFALHAIRAIGAAKPFLPDMHLPIAICLNQAIKHLTDYIQQRLLPVPEQAPEAFLIQFLEAVEARLAIAFAQQLDARASGLATLRDIDHTLCRLSGDWAAINWRGSEIHKIEIHAPRDEGYLRPIYWEQPAQAKLIYYLSRLAQIESFAYPTITTRRIDELAGRLSASRTGMLWKDPKLPDAIFPSNSTVIYLALRTWLLSLPRLVQGRL